MSHRELLYSDGRTMLTINFDGYGKPHGKWTMWYASTISEQKMYEENYIHGKRHGVCTFWTCNGTVNSRIYYENGKAVKVEANFA